MPRGKKNKYHSCMKNKNCNYEKCSHAKDESQDQKEALDSAAVEEKLLCSSSFVLDRFMKSYLPLNQVVILSGLPVYLHP